MIYDSARDRLIVFGGSAGFSRLNDVWELPLAGGAWNQLAPQGDPVPVGTVTSAIYDPVGDRMLVFFGWVVWQLALSGTPTWSALTTAGTPPHFTGTVAVAFDPPRNRALVLGWQPGPFIGPDTWELTLGPVPTWTQVLPTIANNHMTAPGVHMFHAVCDADGLFLVGIYGEYDLTLWQLPFSDLHWNLLSDIAAYRKDDGYSLIAQPDPSLGAGLAFGGYERHVYPPNDYTVVTNDTRWVPGWTLLVTAGTRPVPRFNHAAAYDAARNRMIVFGGAASGGALLGDTWALSLTGTPTWSEIVDSPTPTLLSAFRSRSLADGLELRWRFAEGTEWTRVDLERANGAQGPWLPLDVVTRREGTDWVALDRAAQSGRSYFYRLLVRDRSGNATTFGPFAAALAAADLEPVLSQAAPNPSTGAVRFDLSVPRGQQARASVLDAQGRLVSRLFDAEQQGGTRAILWDGRGDRGPAPAGIYWLRVESAERTMERRFVIAR